MKSLFLNVPQSEIPSRINTGHNSEHKVNVVLLKPDTYQRVVDRNQLS